MELLNWLFSRAPTVFDPPPGPLPHEFIEAASYDDTSDIPGADLLPAAGGVPTELIDQVENVYCTIDYVDAAGHATTRPVTVLALDRRAALPSLFAVCHLRRATRSFRLDRIQQIVTADGEIFDRTSFLTDVLGLKIGMVDIETVGMAIRQKQPRQPVRQSRGFRDLIGAPLSVLVACSRCDGHFHADELDRIMSWAEMEAMHLHRAGLVDHDITLEEADAFRTTISGMRPQARTLTRNIAVTLEMPAEALSRFRRALQNVIHADGSLHPHELRFMADFDELAALAGTNPSAVADRVNAAAPPEPPDLLENNVSSTGRPVYVFTGNFIRVSREQAKAIALGRGHSVKDHVEFAHRFYPGSSLVQGNGGGGGSKIEKSLDRGLPIITEDEFLSRMGL